MNAKLTNPRQWLCQPSTLLREVLIRFNELTYPFHIVTDENDCLMGSVTDGDVRRAVLNGASLDEPVSSCMNRKVISVRDDAGALKAAAQHQVQFVPVLDDANRVVDIVVTGSAMEQLGSCLIMAGGHGTRLGEKTRNTPKPLLPVGEKPILGHILDQLEIAGIGQVFISVHYLSEKIEDFIGERGSTASIELLHEETKLGTAGALSLLPATQDGPVLVLNGDVLTSVNVAALPEFHLRHGHDATIAVARYDFEVPFGVVRQSEDGMFIGIDEKPTIHQFVAAGLYYLGPEIRALVPKNEPMDMPELLNLGKKAGLQIGLFPIHEYWVDVGRPTDLAHADKTFPENKRSRPSKSPIAKPGNS